MQKVPDYRTAGEKGGQHGLGIGRQVKHEPRPACRQKVLRRPNSTVMRGRALASSAAQGLNRARATSDTVATATKTATTRAQQATEF
ncbi:hypothetical protein BA177_14730 [Woeseia oceani]|uniref:Uncharacterized protein n=1 Tax=Woeseia oceani TaxID=1548547 RepID=A0A193LIQ2_9GAMM|nr:hypothetical protein BA177_14730 [Woeseia oceani]